MVQQVPLMINGLAQYFEREMNKPYRQITWGKHHHFQVRTNVMLIPKVHGQI